MKGRDPPKALSLAIKEPRPPESPPISNRTVWVVLAIVVATAAFLRCQYLHVPLERDEGEYAYGGQLLLQGMPPFQLVYNMKLPGTQAVYALAMALFGQTIAGIRIGLLFVNAATILMASAAAPSARLRVSPLQPYSPSSPWGPPS
jgi:hypothetical protein